MEPLNTCPVIPFNWPVRTWPIIHFAGSYINRERGFHTRWFAPAHALHLHLYRGHMRINDQEFELLPGDLTLMDRDSVASYDLPRQGECWCVHFDRNEQARGDLFALPRHIRLGSRRTMAEARLRAIHDMLGGQHSYGLGVAAASAGVQELLLWLAMQQAAEAASGELGTADRAIEDAAAWLTRNLDRPISIPDVAQAVGLSQNYLARRFRERYGTTMPHYLLSRRMEQATWLLTHTDMPIKEVAARVGLADLQHFNKHYRRFHGTSPSAARGSAR